MYYKSDLNLISYMNVNKSESLLLEQLIDMKCLVAPIVKTGNLRVVVRRKLT